MTLARAQAIRFRARWKIVAPPHRLRETMEVLRREEKETRQTTAGTGSVKGNPPNVCGYRKCKKETRQTTVGIGSV